jgi:methionyl-tRNA formyltransferase
MQLHDTAVVGPDELGAKPGAGEVGYDGRSDGLIIGCSQSTYLRVRKVKQENRKLMAARDWWNGHRYSV